MCPKMEFYKWCLEMKQQIVRLPVRRQLAVPLPAEPASNRPAVNLPAKENQAPPEDESARNRHSSKSSSGRGSQQVAGIQNLFVAGRRQCGEMFLRVDS